MRTLLLSAKQTAFDYLSPPCCVACKRGSVWLCRACNLALGDPPELVCPACLHDQERGLLCARCTALNAPLEQLISAYTYESRVFHKLLARYKERGLQAMRPLLVRRLVQQLCVAGLEQRKPVLVHVPCSRARIRQRGFDQAAALAAGLAKQTGLKHAALLGRIKSRSKPQKNLTVLTRRANAKGLYAVLPSEDLQIARLRGVLLVDDVATSLATLETCAMQLRRAGIRDVRAVVLAYAALT